MVVRPAVENYILQPAIIGIVAEELTAPRRARIAAAEPQPLA